MLDGDTEPGGTVASLVMRSQLVMFGSVAVCTALMPGFLFSRDMGGVSNYGVHAETVLPFTVGTLAGAWLLWRAAARSRPLGRSKFALVSRSAAICLLVNLLTTYPYKSSVMWATVHSWTAITLAVVEFVGGVLVLSAVDPGHLRRVASALLVAGFTCLVLTYVGRLHVLFVAEVTTAAAFGLALHTAAGALRARAPTGRF